MGKSLLKDSIQTIGNKFDNIFNQIERGTVILIGGNPGTGKTTMASKLSYDEINKRNGISMYVSLTETKEEYMKNMKKLGVDFESLEKSKRFYFIESITISDKNAVYDFLNQLLQYSDMYNATMIVIDSISSIFQVFRNISEVRELIHNFFYRISKLNKKTLVITEEIPYGSVGFGYGVEEFIVDLIIYLKMVNVKGKSIRIAEIKKFRGSDFQIAEMPFKIKPKQLISIPSFEFSGKGNQQEYIKINLGEKNVIEITKGSQNLIVINPRIDKESLTIFGTFGALIGTQYLTTGSGKTIIFMHDTFIERFKQRLIKCINYIPIEKEKIENIVKNIFFIGINPVELSLVDYFDLINEQECKINPSIVMDMSLDTIYELSGEESLFKSLNFSLINKRVMKKITGFYLINGLYKDVFNFPLYTIYDNIVYVKPYKNNRIIVKPIKMMNSLLPRSSIAINPDEIKYCMQ